MGKWIQIAQHIPLGIVVLFFGLLLLGLLQARARKLSLSRVLLLPFAMIAFSLYGVIAAFGIGFGSIAYWVAGIMLALLCNYFYRYPKDVQYDPEKRVFSLRGSFVPLALMMGIYFTKFFVGYAEARALAIIEDATTISMICVLLGFFSGMFFASGYVLYRIKNASST
jgi:hypothetical protein